MTEAPQSTTEVGEYYRRLIESQHPAHTWTHENIKKGMASLFALFGKPITLSGFYEDGTVLLCVRKPEDTACLPLGDELASIMASVPWRTGAPCYGFQTGPNAINGWWYIRECDLHHLLLGL